jgi:hypothetical protein
MSRGVAERIQAYPLNSDVNMDEMSWKLLMHGFGSVADRRSDAVTTCFDGEPKMCLTATAVIDAAGQKSAHMSHLSGKNNKMRVVLLCLE